jgi:hypothetical protein
MPAAAPPAEISSPMIREMFAYWQRRAAGRMAPRPREIEPGDIKRLLPFISIADILREPFDLRFRLAGSGVVEATGYDFTGHRLSEMPITTGREAWTAHYARVVNDKRPHYGRYRGDFGPELVRYVDQGAFPLSSDGSAVDRLIEIEDWSEFRGVGLARLEQSVWRFEPLPASPPADKL